MKNIKATIQMACARREAADNEIKDVRAHLVSQAGVMTAERYGELAAALRVMISSKLFPEPHREFVRLAFSGRGEGVLADFAEALSFVKLFLQRREMLGEAFDAQDTGRGDDGHGDLLDAMAIAPEASFTEMVAFPERFFAFEKANKDSLADLLNRELYNEMFLEGALDTFLPGATADMEDEAPAFNVEAVPVVLRIEQTAADGTTAIRVVKNEAESFVVTLPQGEFLRALSGTRVDASFAETGRFSD